MRIKNWIGLLVFWISFSALAQNGKAAFAQNREMEPTVRAVAAQMRCPVCRGVPIAESPSEMARDMTQMIRQQLAEGKSEAEILQFFEDRYGEWILLKPKPKGIHLSLWILPALFLSGGFVLIGLAVRRWTG